MNSRLSGFSIKDLRTDLVAGLTFALVNVPQGLGEALLATAKPLFGICTLMIAA